MRHFRLEELDSPYAPGSGAGMDRHFLELVDRIREDAGIPVVITSEYRTVGHNAELGPSERPGGRYPGACRTGQVADRGSGDSNRNPSHRDWQEFYPCRQRCFIAQSVDLALLNVPKQGYQDKRDAGIVALGGARRKFPSLIRWMPG